LEGFAVGLFGPDQITLQLEKTNYKPGDVIKGTVTLNLKKPMNARKLEVAFFGIGFYRDHHRPGSPGPGSANFQNKIYQFDLPLDNEKEYLTGTYSFEIKIPEGIFNPSLEEQMRIRGIDPNSRTGSFISTAGAALGSLGGGNLPYRIDWWVKANLDMPLKLDVSKKQQIVLSQ
jgi:hypothetical protein